MISYGVTIQPFGSGLAYAAATAFYSVGIGLPLAPFAFLFVLVYTFAQGIRGLFVTASPEDQLKFSF